MTGAGSWVLDAVRVVLWWILVIASLALILHYRKNRSNGWTLYKLVVAVIVCQTLYMSMWAIHNSTVRTVGFGTLTDNLYRICIPLEQLATSSFMGLLLVLAAGYCITRNNLGDYKVQVVGLPVLIFVTGVVTQYINFQLLEASTDQLDVLDMAGWEAGLFAVCTFVNVAAFMFWVVYIFEIIQVEADALRAQQELNLVRNAAPSATVAPFPAAPGAPGTADGLHSDPHTAPPAGMDPDWTRAAAEEGIVAYKNLLGPGQNMSHIPGADVEAQEITTVADMLNFETKKTMYKRFSTGFGVFMIAQLCVILAPVFIIDVVQDVITVFQFLVVYGFLAALLWLFRPLADSPYLLMGEDVGHLDTSLGVETDDDEEEVGEQGVHGLQQNGYGSGASNAGRTGGAGVELMSQPAGQGPKRFISQGGGLSGGGGRVISNGSGGGPAGTSAGDKKVGRDQDGSSSSSSAAAGGAAAGGVLPVSNSARDLHPVTPGARGSGSMAAMVANPPVRLPAIRTSVGGQPSVAAVSGSNQQQQHGVGDGSGSGPKWSIGDDDDLHEVTLSPQKRD